MSRRSWRRSRVSVLISRRSRWKSLPFGPTAPAMPHDAAIAIDNNKLRNSIVFIFRFLLKFIRSRLAQVLQASGPPPKRQEERQRLIRQMLVDFRVIFRGEPLTNAFRRGQDAGGRSFYGW